jgi:hypothetical protein
MGQDPRRMPPPLPVAGLPAPDPEAVASGWLAELLAGAPLAAAPALASADFARAAPGVAAAVAAALGGEPAFGGPDGPGEVLSRLAAPLPPGGPPAVVAAGEALRRATARALGPALAGAPELAGPVHDRLAWALAALVQAALAEPVVTDARPGWTVLVEVADADRLAAAGQLEAMQAAGAALAAELGRGARCAPDGPGRWRVTGAGPGAAARLADAVQAVPGPHGVALRAHAGEGPGPEAAEDRLLAARAAGVAVLP